MQDDLIERLAEGVRLVGLNEDDSVELYDIEDANEAMFEAKERIAALEAELERRKYDGIHTCSDACPRPACVLRRENAALEADNARLMGLVEEAGEALEDFCQAAEYWAGCDEGCTADAAGSEIMSSGGAWPSTAYDKSRATLAKLKEATDGR